MYVCVYIYMCIYIHTYIYTHIDEKCMIHTNKIPLHEETCDGREAPQTKTRAFDMQRHTTADALDALGRCA